MIGDVHQVAPASSAPSATHPAGGATEAGEEAKASPSALTKLVEEEKRAATNGTGFDTKPDEAFPPNYVFAPGFMYADRRGLVPYPGLALTSTEVSRFLAQRWVDDHQLVYEQAQQAYRDAMALHQAGDADYS